MRPRSKKNYESRGKSGPWRKDMNASADDVPAFNVPDGWRPDPADLATAPVIKDWRRLGSKLTGVLDDDIQTIPGVIVKLFVRGGWVLMDDDTLYQLGARAYAGT